MARNNQHFGELEYCFNQYFSKYCAPVIAKDYRYYHRKQTEEFYKAYNEMPANIGAGSVMQGMIRVQTANVNASSSGKWWGRKQDCCRQELPKGLGSFDRQVSGISYRQVRNKRLHKS